MTTIKLTMPAEEPPGEQAQLVASVATAVAEFIGSHAASFDFKNSQQLTFGAVAHRIDKEVRWRA
jgi:hypothetical protein